MHRIKIISIAQMLCGVGALGVGIAGFATMASYGVYASAGGSGLWSGIFYVVTGVTGFLAAKRLKESSLPEKSKTFVTASLIMSILSALMATALMVTFSFFMAMEPKDLILCPSNYSVEYDRWNSQCTRARILVKEILPANLVFSILMVIFSVVQTVFAAMAFRNPEYRPVVRT